MASLRHESSKGRSGWRIRFRDRTKRQRSIWLGDIAEHVAKETLAHVEHLVACQRDNIPPSSLSTRWLASDATLCNKLATAGLCDGTEQQEIREVALGNWIDTYISERTDVSPNTIKTYRKAKANLVDYFGADRKIRSIAKADAKRWRIWVATESNKRDKNRKELADATVRRRTGKAKQFFKEAKERGLVDFNPFAGLPSTVKANEDRQFAETGLD